MFFAISWYREVLGGIEVLGAGGGVGDVVPLGGGAAVGEVVGGGGFGDEDDVCPALVHRKHLLKDCFLLTSAQPQTLILSRLNSDCKLILVIVNCNF